jgi:hypothetical protein
MQGNREGGDGSSWLVASVEADGDGGDDRFLALRHHSPFRPNWQEGN